jgi:hypothetical protein
MNRERYLTPSEIGQFVFCCRSWHLKRQGAQSSNQPQMDRGTAAHERHFDRVQAGARARSLAPAFGIAALILIAVFLLLAFVR